MFNRSFLPEDWKQFKGHILLYRSMFGLIAGVIEEVEIGQEALHVSLTVAVCFLLHKATQEWRDMPNPTGLSLSIEELAPNPLEISLKGSYSFVVNSNEVYILQNNEDLRELDLPILPL